VFAGARTTKGEILSEHQCRSLIPVIFYRHRWPAHYRTSHLIRPITTTRSRCWSMVASAHAPRLRSHVIFFVGIHPNGGKVILPQTLPVVWGTFMRPYRTPPRSHPRRNAGPTSLARRRISIARRRRRRRSSRRPRRIPSLFVVRRRISSSFLWSLRSCTSDLPRGISFSAAISSPVVGVPTNSVSGADAPRGRRRSRCVRP
jgi:hypothetical protein